MIITIASLKGGVGKTTSAVHLACYFARKHGQDSVLLIDGDSLQVATEWANAGNLPFRVVSKAEADAARDFEHVIIDTPANPDAAEIGTLAGNTDLLIVPATPNKGALNGVMRTVEAAGDSTEHRILLTRVKPRGRAYRQVRAALEAYGHSVFDGCIECLVAHEDAEAYGMPVYELSGPYAQRAWQDYERIGAQIDA